MNSDGRESECQIKRAALCEYAENSLRIYGPGVRDLTEDEKKALSACAARVKEYDEKNPWGSCGYLIKKDFLRKRGFAYLDGSTFDQGKRLTWNGGEQKIVDYDIRGELELEYKTI